MDGKHKSKNELNVVPLQKKKKKILQEKNKTKPFFFFKIHFHQSTDGV